MKRRFLVAQLGARMHYAVPRILHEAGLLGRLFTDFSVQRGWPRLLRALPSRARPKSVDRLLARTAKGLPSEKISAFNMLGLRYALQLRSCRSPSERSAVHLATGAQFCRRVLASGLDSANAVYTFNTAGLELLRSAKQRGLFTVTEQTIAPKRLESELLTCERAMFPDWEEDGGVDHLAGEVAAREAAEWEVADVILCACEFVKMGVELCDGPVQKCRIVPYGLDLEQAVCEEKDGSMAEECSVGRDRADFQHRPLRVLTVGAIGLRKGSPYVLETAREMKGAVEFRMVGKVGVKAAVEKDLRESVELVGVVPRSQVAGHFEWADVFLLPSLCEGSATVTYEALAYGLPVLCTPNTGSVARDGVDGFIVPPRDVGAIVDLLERLRADPGLRAELAANARRRAEEFTLAAYGRRLLTALEIE